MLLDERPPNCDTMSSTPHEATPTHQVSILVHGSGEAIQVSIGIVQLHILLVGSPYVESHQLFFITGILFAIHLGTREEGDKGIEIRYNTTTTLTTNTTTSQNNDQVMHYQKSNNNQVIQVIIVNPGPGPRNKMPYKSLRYPKSLTIQRPCLFDLGYTIPIF